MDKFNNRKHIFKNLPVSSILSLPDSKELFKEEIDLISKDEEQEKEILNLVCQKVTCNDKDFLWTKEDYEEFKNAIIKVTNKEINLLYTSINKALTTSNSDIYKQLLLFSKEVDWYPLKEKVYNTEQHKDIYINKEIKVTDCFYIINIIYSYFLQYVSNYATNVMKIHMDDDINEVIKKRKLEFLEGYVRKYNYLKKYPLFKEIYVNVYNESLKILSQRMTEIKNKNASNELKKIKYRADTNNKYTSNFFRNYRKR